MSKNDFCLFVKHINKNVSSKAQIKNTDYSIIRNTVTYQN